jgi:hypothetical protein
MEVKPRKLVPNSTIRTIIDSIQSYIDSLDTNVLTAYLYGYSTSQQSGESREIRSGTRIVYWDGAERISFLRADTQRRIDDLDCCIHCKLYPPPATSVL